MSRFVVHRLLGAAGAVVGASIVSFIVLRAVPGDPARLILGPRATDAQVAAFGRSLGLDNSLPHQYLDYMAQFVRGDWGYSYTSGATVRAIFSQRLGASVELAAVAFSLALLAAVLCAVL